MTRVTLGLGSNINPAENFSRCLDTLLLKFHDLGFSSVFESEAVGFAGDNFLNMVVSLETELSLDKLATTLKDIEDDFGRKRDQPRFSGRTLDIDILTYGNKSGIHAGMALPRPESTENAFVLWTLSQLAGNQRHPELGKTYKELWEEFDKTRQKLWPVDFIWHGRQISVRQ